jgi:hypothetical protein
VFNSTAARRLPNTAWKAAHLKLTQLDLVLNGRDTYSLATVKVSDLVSGSVG